ncbi:hypothetical protein EKG37_17690 [Robertmurraya yapensis]|uniref:Conjugal transfer protein TrbC n=1 Tax=Bacillus yapensis TaxID=2492960 RepID=A0A431VY23_9BACI|nr:TrbC/VirB2 family protein [Bacillus yapensis]RTR28134.1 hypothetical protein EKG37_17690 [Bacillus yapensis]TKS94377.1 hypothetical protein FAR12_17695 [Bacillus yapensis]
MKKKVKSVLPYFMVIGFMVTLGLVAPEMASASQIPLIKGGSGGDVTDITQLLQDWITQIRIIGVVVIVIALIIAGIIIGISLGNATKRALGIAAMIAAVIGIVLVMKAPDLANYFINQSQT